GLAVWHIDERQSNNDNPLAYLVALLQADGKKDLELLKNSGDGGDLFPGDKCVAALDDNTTPSTRANMGSPSRVVLTNIAVSGGILTLQAAVSLPINPGRPGHRVARELPARRTDRPGTPPANQPQRQSGTPAVG